MLGFLIGAVAMGPIGYATGPSLGYGKIDACYEVSDTRLCTDSLSREEFDRLQRSQDQSRGALAFALFGGTVGAIVARRTANEWLLVEPPATAGGGEAWTVGVRVPLTNR